MKKPISILATIALLALPSTSHALPRTVEGWEVQMKICSDGLEMILAGASDDDELDFYLVELERNGWVGENDLDDLMMLCNAFKKGYLYAREG